MNIPADLRYSKDHEWARIEDDTAVIGITDFAQGELGDIIFVEFPDNGRSFARGDTFGTVEAVKTVADLYMPLGGEILEINSALDDAPEAVNNDPYGAGWLVKIRLADAGQTSELLDAKAYQEIIGQ
jgi:glycine cleavage system H protein